MPETRTIEDIDHDIRELRAKQLKARAAREDDYALVLTAALNRALSERLEMTRAAARRR